MSNPFTQLFNTSIRWRKQASVDSWGKPTFGAWTVALAKWRDQSGIATSDGIVATTAHVIHILPANIAANDEVELPNGEVHPVKNVRQASLPGGPGVMEVSL